MKNIFSKDFYLDKAGLAAYFEKEWCDLLLSQENINFDFAPFDTSHLSRGDSRLVSKSVLELIKRTSIQPQSYLEIGPGLGRAFYEITKETPSLKKSRLVEPSEYLAKTLRSLFLSHSPSVFPLILGNEHLSEIKIDPFQIRENLKSVDLEIINRPFNKASNDVEMSDLVLCLNVLDQCKEPFSLLELIKAKTNPSGMLVVSCTFQWQKKYLGSNVEPFTNLRSQFGDEWEVLSEENLPFSIRINERFWYTFLSQVLYLKRRNID